MFGLRAWPTPVRLRSAFHVQLADPGIRCAFAVTQSLHLASISLHLPCRAFVQVWKPMWPFYVAGAITMYGVSKLQDAALKSASALPLAGWLLTGPALLDPEIANDPRNPYGMGSCLNHRSVLIFHLDRCSKQKGERALDGWSMQRVTMAPTRNRRQIPLIWRGQQPLFHSLRPRSDSGPLRGSNRGLHPVRLHQPRLLRSV